MAHTNNSAQQLMITCSQMRFYQKTCVPLVLERITVSHTAINIISAETALRFSQ